MKLIRASIAPIARDVAGCSGFAMIFAGVREIYAPAGLIVAGVCLVGAAVQMARRG